MEFKDLPQHVQEAIARREAVTKPLRTAIESLDLSWEITRGNLAELDSTLKEWEGQNWRAIHNDAAARYRYHRLILRQFHNFLASAVSAIDHARPLVSRLRHVAPDLSTEYVARLEGLTDSDRYHVLKRLRDYAIHRGHHATVLVLRDRTSANEGHALEGFVSFDVVAVRSYIQGETRRGRGKRQGLRLLAGILAEQAEPNMRDLLTGYYEEVGGLFRSLRKTLVEAWTSAQNRPLREWSASPELWTDPDR
jgi:hypothetical protein